MSTRADPPFGDGIDGETLERLFQRGLVPSKEDLLAAAPHWMILKEMAASLMREDED